MTSQILRGHSRFGNVTTSNGLQMLCLNVKETKNGFLYFLPNFFSIVCSNIILLLFSIFIFFQENYQ